MAVGVSLALYYAHVTSSAARRIGIQHLFGEHTAMSYDLSVVTREKAHQKDIEAFFSSQSGFAIDGLLDGSNSNLAVDRRTRQSAHTAFLVDGPFQVELDDLEDDIIAAV